MNEMSSCVGEGEIRFEDVSHATKYKLYVGEARRT